MLHSEFEPPCNGTGLRYCTVVYESAVFATGTEKGRGIGEQGEISRIYVRARGAIQLRAARRRWVTRVGSRRSFWSLCGIYIGATGLIQPLRYLCNRECVGIPACSPPASARMQPRGTFQYVVPIHARRPALLARDIRLEETSDHCRDLCNFPSTHEVPSYVSLVVGCRI